MTRDTFHEFVSISQAFSFCFCSLQHSSLKDRHSRDTAWKVKCLQSTDHLMNGSGTRYPVREIDKPHQLVYVQKRINWEVFGKKD